MQQQQQQQYNSCHASQVAGTSLLLSHDSFRAEVEELKQRIRACKTVHDYFQLTEKANQIAKAAASACRRRQLLLEPVGHCCGVVIP